MKSPTQNTPESFCELVASEIINQWGHKSQQEISKSLRTSTKTWLLIRDKKISNLIDGTAKKRKSWLKTITKGYATPLISAMRIVWQHVD